MKAHVKRLLIFSQSLKILQFFSNVLQKVKDKKFTDITKNWTQNHNMLPHLRITEPTVLAEMSYYS